MESRAPCHFAWIVVFQIAIGLKESWYDGDLEEPFADGLLHQVLARVRGNEGKACREQPGTTQILQPRYFRKLNKTFSELFPSCSRVVHHRFILFLTFFVSTSVLGGIDTIKMMKTSPIRKMMKTSKKYQFFIFHLYLGPMMWETGFRVSGHIKIVFYIMFREGLASWDQI